MLPDGVHVSADVVAIDDGCPRGGGEQACQDGPTVQGADQRSEVQLNMELVTPAVMPVGAAKVQYACITTSYKPPEDDRGYVK